MWIKYFPFKSSASSTFIPHTIMTGTTLYCQKHRKAEFGVYYEVHE